MTAIELTDIFQSDKDGKKEIVNRLVYWMALLKSSKGCAGRFA